MKLTLFVLFTALVVVAAEETEATEPLEEVDGAEKRSIATGSNDLRPSKKDDEQVEEDQVFNMKRSLALGRVNFRPGKRSLALGRVNFRPGKKSLALGRVNFRPGKKSLALGRVNFRPGKKSLALGRVNFRPGKRSLALGRVNFRPGKRSLALGRVNFRPGKRQEGEEEKEEEAGVEDGDEAVEVKNEDGEEKRSAAFGRLNFRPGKRSLALGRADFRPGKRSLALGRVNFRPGKRDIPATCSYEDTVNIAHHAEELFSLLEAYAQYMTQCEGAVNLPMKKSETSESD